MNAFLRRLRRRPPRTRIVPAAALVTLLATACAPTVPLDEAPTDVVALVVAAGDHDRRMTPATFDAAGLAPGTYRMRAAGAPVLTAQVDADGRGWFVLDELAAGAERVYRLDPLPEAPPDERPRPAVRVAAGDGAYAFFVGHAPLLTYRFAPVAPPAGVDALYRRGGFVHPVRTPSGAVVTDAYARDHRHQHGIWSAWTVTEFEGRSPDFWNMGDGTGGVEPVAVDASWSGAVQGGVRARHRFVDRTVSPPVAVLEETWTLRAWAVPGDEVPYHVFDLDVVQTTSGDAPLVLPVHRYGGVGFRGPWAWNGPAGTSFLTSEGRTRADGHGTRARWVHAGGLVDGRLAGVAVLGHPSNERAPQPLRIHPEEPFFNFAPTQLGPLTIAPEAPYRARYRYVVMDDEPDAALIERLWRDYAEPLVVQRAAME